MSRNLSKGAEMKLLTYLIAAPVLLALLIGGWPWAIGVGMVLGSILAIPLILVGLVIGNCEEANEKRKNNKSRKEYDYENDPFLDRKK